MTREEYCKEVNNRFPNNIFSVDSISFPVLLRKAAISLFIFNDFESELSLETHRRLKQLSELGFTDE